MDKWAFIASLLGWGGDPQAIDAKPAVASIPVEVRVLSGHAGQDRLVVQPVDEGGTFVFEQQGEGGGDAPRVMVLSRQARVRGSDARSDEGMREAQELLAKAEQHLAESRDLIAAGRPEEALRRIREARQAMDQARRVSRQVTRGQMEQPAPEASAGDAERPETDTPPGVAAGDIPGEGAVVIVRPEGGGTTASAGARTGKVRVEIRTRTQGPDGKINEKVEVREFPLGEGASVAVAREPDRAQAAEAELPAREARESAAALAARAAASRAAEVRERLEALARERQGQQSATPGGLVGVGLMLEEEEGALIVRGVLPDSPAARVGSIQENDRVVGIAAGDDTDEIRFEGKPLEEAVQMIRGPEGTTVRLLVQTGDDEPRVVELTRAALNTPRPEAEEDEDMADQKDSDNEDDDDDADDEDGDNDDDDDHEGDRGEGDVD